MKVFTFRLGILQIPYLRIYQIVDHRKMRKTEFNFTFICTKISARILQNAELFSSHL
jgi:hypothetical protein